MSVKGKGSRDKGSRAERKFRDFLRSIYPARLRKNVQRVPMSGAGYIKGDVADNNDPDSCYEVKNQENVHLPEWWRQTTSQAGFSRTPILVITQAYRPFYVIMQYEAWEALLDSAYDELDDGYYYAKVKSGDKIFDQMADLPTKTLGRFFLGDSDLVIMPVDDYIKTKRLTFEKYNV